MGLRVGFELDAHEIRDDERLEHLLVQNAVLLSLLVLAGGHQFSLAAIVSVLD